MKRSLHNDIKLGAVRFFLVAIGAFILGLCVVNFFRFVESKQTQLSTLLQVQKTRLDALFDSRVERLLFYQRVRGGGVPTSDELTSLIIGSYQFESVSLISPEGRVEASSDARLLGKDYSTQGFFAAGRLGRVIQPFSYDPGRKVLTLTVAVPWRFPQGRTGVLAGEVLNSEIKEILTATPSAEPYRVYAYAPPAHSFLPVPGNSNWESLPASFKSVLGQVFLKQPSRGLRESPAGGYTVNATHWHQDMGLALWVEASLSPLEVMQYIPWYYYILSTAVVLVFFLLRFERLRPRFQDPLAEIEKLIKDITARRTIKAFPAYGTHEYQTLSQELEELYRTHFANRSLVISNEHYFSRLIEHSADFIVLVSFEGRIQYASPSLLRAYRISEEDLLGKSILDISRSSPDRWFRLVNNLMNGQAFNRDRYTISYNGITLILDGRFSILPGTESAEPQIVINARDITEQENLANALAKKEKLESIYQFSGGVAHDFSNLLMGMLGHLSVAQLKLEQNEGNPLAEIRSVQQEILKARELIQSLMAVSQGGVFKIENLDLSEALSAAWSPYAASSRLTYQVESSCGKLVQADKEKTLAVLEEIFNNAVYFMGGSGVITVNCRVVEKRTAGPEQTPKTWVELSIIDSGPGMDETQLKRVFEPYYSSRGSGRGLGLAMVYSVMEAMGGFAELESRLGLGTSVNLYFKPV